MEWGSHVWSQDCAPSHEIVETDSPDQGFLLALEYFSL